MMRLAVRALGLVALALALPAGQARAELQILMSQVGADVFVNASGSVNTGGLSVITSWGDVGGIAPSVGGILMGGTSNLTGDVYDAIFGPDSFGSGGLLSASSGSGGFGLTAASNTLLLPSGYVSGSALTGTMTFVGQTFSSLGVTPGTYTYTWGRGENADSAVLQIGQTQTEVPVPAPSTLALLASGAACLAVGRRRRP